MLTNLTVTITVRLVEPRINEGMLLPVGTDFVLIWTLIYIDAKLGKIQTSCNPQCTTHFGV